MSEDAAAVPEWARWGQRQGIILPRNPRDENGNSICRWCHGPIKPPRRKWCSQDCVSAYLRFFNWAAVRNFVKERDDETCQRCGTTDPPIPKRRKGRQQRYDPWDVDHIQPVAQGGTDDPANLRLLCHPCHEEVGYEQRGTRPPPTDKADPPKQLAFL